MGAYTLLQDLTVSTNSTSVVLNDFGTITKDDFIKFVITHVNSTANVTGIYDLFPNGNTTGSNYHSQKLVGLDSTVAAARVSNNEVAETSAAATTFGYIKLSENDRYNHFANTNRDTVGTNVRLFFTYTTSSGATFPNGITSLTLVARQGTIGTGSRIQIYKLDAEKIADITVASNTTQVDISNLSIDKDSEYLLVSENKRVSSGSITKIIPNDLTTATQYFTQRIIGSASSATAARTNDNLAFIQDTVGTTISYTHIKVSNIGAFTSQSYNIINSGSSSPAIQNNFVSSTYENLTTITKLSFIRDSGNIETGSRFILYKLYE